MNTGAKCAVASLNSYWFRGPAADSTPFRRDCVRLKPYHQPLCFASPDDHYGLDTSSEAQYLGSVLEHWVSDYCPLTAEAQPSSPPTGKAMPGMDAVRLLVRSVWTVSHPFPVLKAQSATDQRLKMKGHSLSSASAFFI